MNAKLSAQPGMLIGGTGVNDNTVFFTPWTLQGRMVRANPVGGLVQGSDRSDLLLDGPANDQIIGLAGDDLYVSFTGHDLVDFGPGLDVAMYFSPRANFRISGSSATWLSRTCKGLRATTRSSMSSGCRLPTRAWRWTWMAARAGWRG